MEGLAMSAAPPRALSIWASGSDIYLEIPGKGNLPPYITRYPYDSRGLCLILDLLGAHRIDYDYALAPVPSAYRSNIISKGPGTPEQQAAADRALRLAGLLKP